MGSVGKPLSWIDRNIPYVLIAAAALEAVAIKYLGFPVITPTAAAAGISCAAYKAVRFAASELNATLETRRQQRTRPSPGKDISSKLDR